MMTAAYLRTRLPRPLANKARTIAQSHPYAVAAAVTAGALAISALVNRRLARNAENDSKRGCNSQKVFHPMTHFTRQQFVGFFGLLALGDVEEDAKHNSVGYVSVVALTPRGDPANINARQDPEVDFVSAYDRTRRGERRPDPLIANEQRPPREVSGLQSVCGSGDYPAI